MPKKIYLFDYNDAMVTPLEGDTVYIREDAFIKKACEFLFKNYHGEKLSTRMIENFRKYLKGE